MNKNNRKIIHLDMDAFYASIEERDNPSLRGKPVIVGADPHSRGVVSTCNYIARKYGVRSAMSSQEAYRRCPHGIFIHGHYEKYKEASQIVHSIMSEYTDQVEFLSLDEGYMDVTGSTLLFGSAEDIAKEIQKRVYESVGTTCSVGVGYCMMAAKYASEEKKPNGFFVISSPEEFINLTKDRSVGELYGVGKKTAEKLISMGIKTIGQLAAVPDSRLISFGNSGAEMKNFAKGIDLREVTPNMAPKSIGKETTFQKDTLDRKLLCDTLLLLSNNVSFRLYKHNLWCRTVTLKLKYSDMKSITRSYSGDHLRSCSGIYNTAVNILNNLNLEKPVRLIGVSASNLTDSNYDQLSFDETNIQKSSKKELGDTILELKTKFGIDSIKTANEINAENHLLCDLDMD